MNTCMTPSTRGAREWFVDDMIAAIEGWNIDAVIVTAHIPCKHGQAIHGFVRDACREREKPLLLVEIDVQDPRPVSIDTVRNQVADFLENQVLPSLSSVSIQLPKMIEALAPQKARKRRPSPGAARKEPKGGKEDGRRVRATGKASGRDRRGLSGHGERGGVEDPSKRSSRPKRPRWR